MFGFHYFYSQIDITAQKSVLEKIYTRDLALEKIYTRDLVLEKIYARDQWRDKMTRDRWRVNRQTHHR